jgi:hypothetical protein
MFSARTGRFGSMMEKKLVAPYRKRGKEAQGVSHAVSGEEWISKGGFLSLSSALCFLYF